MISNDKCIERSEAFVSQFNPELTSESLRGMLKWSYQAGYWQALTDLHRGQGKRWGAWSAAFGVLFVLSVANLLYGWLAH